GPRLGLRLVRTAPGGWLLGPGLPMLAVAGAAVAMLALRRRHAPSWAYAVLAACGAGYVVAFSWLRAQHLERTHLPEYGVAAPLASTREGGMSSARTSERSPSPVNSPSSDPVAEDLPRTRAFILLRYTLIAATAYLILVECEFTIPPVGVVLAIAFALLSNVC